jgi:hypothetical protein
MAASIIRPYPREFLGFGSILQEFMGEWRGFVAV